MRPGRRPLVAGAAGLVTLVLFVGNPNFRHPGLTTRRLSGGAADAVDAFLSLAGRNLNVSEYISGQWHHDRCAKRVKCFLFLDAVDSESHPMKLIRGMLKSFDEAGGYVAFEAARVEGAVLVGLMDRRGKLPEVLADIVAAFLGLPRGARKKSPE